jgi:predicted aconitase
MLADVSREFKPSSVSSDLHLTDEERAMLDGNSGPGKARAMDWLCRYARMVDAVEMTPITSAHIDSCLYHGQVSLDFAKSFSSLNARVSVLTTLNVAALDSVNPEMHQDEPVLLEAQRELTNAYVSMGCLPTLTCAPYQRLQRPGPGDHIAWAESNAIVFANSVLGARTERYGDFIDLCAAITGRAPKTGLHLDEPRLATLVVPVAPLDETPLSRDLYFAAAGYCLGKLAGDHVAVLTGMPRDSSEDELKSLGAAAASTGSVALFHVAGVTPEAPTLEAACGARSDLPQVEIPAAGLQEAVRNLCPVSAGEPVAAVCLGTPHFSLSEFESLANLVADRRSVVDFYVSTSREIVSQLADQPWAGHLTEFGVKTVVDTCTYLSPVVRHCQGVILTNSGKWAHYGPGNLGRRIGLMSLSDCLLSAERGHVAG